MSIALMTLAWKSPLPTGQKVVLLALCDNANDQGECYPSVTMLAQKCSMTDRSIQRHIADLEKAGILARELRTGRSTVYRINPRKFVTPDEMSPPTQSHPTPDIVSPLPPKRCHPTPETVSPITIKEPSKEPSRNRQKATGEPVAVLGVSDLEALGVEKQVARDWLTIRKNKRCPLTPTALEEFIAAVEKAGLSLPNAVRFCCGKGWAAFNVKWLEKNELDALPRRRTSDVIL